MSTRSDIIVHRADGKWARVYCHFDGYLEGVGQTLFEHYNDQGKAEALIEPGDMSSLSEKCDKPEGHSYESGVDGYTVYYGRDRGETGTETQVFDSLAEAWPAEDTWTEFTYVFAADDTHPEPRWMVGDPDEGTQTLIDLGDALAGKRTLCPSVKAFGAVIGQHLPASPDGGHKWSR